MEPMNLSDEILSCAVELIAEGISLSDIAKQFGVAPGALLRRITRDEDGQRQYDNARKAAADLFESEMIDVIRAVTPKTAIADRTKIDGMRWICARRSPARYSERVQVDNLSSDGSMTPKSTVDAAKLSDKALTELMAARNAPEPS